MTTLDRIVQITARGHADADDLAFLADSLGASHKAEQRGAATALAALARAGCAIESVLTAALADTSPRRRWGAVYAWSLLGPVPARCLPVLLDALGADDGDLRWAAATIVRALRDRPAVADALRTLLGSPSALQRKMALYCLRDLGSRAPGLSRELRAALDDPDAAVRLAAMSALVQLAEDRAEAARALARRLDDVDAGVRRAAAAALGQAGVPDPDLIAALRRARDAGDPALARAAAGALAVLERR